MARGAVGGLLSTANDLAKYYKALMKLWRSESQPEKNSLKIEDEEAVFADILWLFAPIQIMGTPARREKAMLWDGPEVNCSEPSVILASIQDWWIRCPYLRTALILDWLFGIKAASWAQPLLS